MSLMLSGNFNHTSNTTHTSTDMKPHFHYLIWKENFENSNLLNELRKLFHTQTHTRTHLIHFPTESIIIRVQKHQDMQTSLTAMFFSKNIDATAMFLKEAYIFKYNC